MSCGIVVLGVIGAFCILAAGDFQEQSIAFAIVGYVFYTGIILAIFVFSSGRNRDVRSSWIYKQQDLSNGYKLYVTGADNDTVYEYSMLAPWELSTASYTGSSFDLSEQDPDPRGRIIIIDNL